MTRIAVVYDGHCRLCVGSVERMRRWPKAGELAFVPLQSPEAKALVPGKTEQQLAGEMHVVEDGRVTAGADGWFRLMRFAPLRLRWIAWILPRALARPLYAWVARNRYRWFGSTCAEGTCAVHPREKSQAPNPDSQQGPPPSGS